MNRIATSLASLAVLLAAAATFRPAPSAQDASQHTAADQEARRAEMHSRWLEPDDSLQARPARELNGEFADRIIMIADQIDPAMAQRLRAMCDHDPSEFSRTIQKSGRKLVSLAELQVRDPDLFELKVAELRLEAQLARIEAQLHEAYRSGSEREAAALQQDLRNAVLIHVALSIKARGDYLRRLQEHVQALQEEIHREATNFDQTVDRKVRQIVERARSQAQDVAAADGVQADHRR
ncbi:MAG TPA: hypothetical protein PK400_02405 [Phycisphaerales bacterium]|nr:hypothetical protein [Phycisphaerales bacterium]HRQ75743.1 hypothetical protein [Phycisphaerales bacterium]